MFRKGRKLLAAVTALLMVMLFGSMTAAAPDQSDKESRRPMQAETMSIGIMSVTDISNEYVAAKIGPDGLFNFGLKPIGYPDWYNISYSWPSDPWSSFSTVRIDGADQVLGTGGQVQPPTNVDLLTNETVWRLGDVSVRQVIQAGFNPSTGRPDAAQIRYTMTNTGSSPHDVGLRIMIDTMLQRNDGAPFRVPGPSGMEAVTYEREYLGTDVPSFWQAFRDLTDPTVSSQWTVRGGGATAPDRLAIAYWGTIEGTGWDYAINPGRSVTSDSAVGMWWNPQPLDPGESRTIVQYYGAPNVGGTPDLAVSCPNQLRAREWQETGFTFNLVAYFNNTTNNAYENVSMQVSTTMDLPDGNPVHTIGSVGPASSAQTTWRLTPQDPGLETITVRVENDGQLLAEESCQVDVLPPPIPDNVWLSNIYGVNEDGVPVAGSMSPLTVKGLFPGADAVALEAGPDGLAPIYTASMADAGGGNWVHTFVPWAVGLTSSPIEIELIPHYPDGTTGPEVEFDVILIDPSGLIYNAARGLDWVLPDATVTLEYYDPALVSWIVLSDEAYPGRFVPVTNPETSLSDGSYAWDVLPGLYRVRASRPGFEPNISPDVTIPPAVTDLHIGLMPNDFAAPVITVGTAGTGPVAVTASATDDVSGVRSVAYQVDGGAWVEVMGDTASVTVSENGAHTVVMKATDWAGNEAVEQVTFTIGQCTANPVLTFLPPLDQSGAQVGAPLPIQFTWTRCGSPVEDKSVSVRVRNAANNRLISGYTYGAGITYDPATGIYTQNFNPALYGLAAGTRVKIQVYFGGKLKGTTEAIFQ